MALTASSIEVVAIDRVKQPWLIPHLLRMPNSLFLIIARKMLDVDPLAKSSMSQDLERSTFSVAFFFFLLFFFFFFFFFPFFFFFLFLVYSQTPFAFTFLFPSEHETEIDFLQGEIIRAGRKVQFSTPINSAIYKLILDQQTARKGVCSCCSLCAFLDLSLSLFHSLPLRFFLQCFLFCLATPTNMLI